MRYKLIIILLVFLLAACGEGTPTEEDSSYEEESPAVSFNNLDMQVEDIIFRLTGEVRTNEETIYYYVMQGDEVLLNEKEVEVASNNDWTDFEIANELPGEVRDGEEAPILTLYGKTDSGQEINHNYIPIDIGIRN